MFYDNITWTTKKFPDLKSAWGTHFDSTIPLEILPSKNTQECKDV